MKFSAAGGWWGSDWYNKVELGYRYGFDGVEQLGWLGLDFDKAKKTLDETGVTSTAIIIQSANKSTTALSSGATAWYGKTQESPSSKHSVNPLPQLRL